jgi:hypothetical protein
MFAITWTNHIHQVAEKAGKLETVEQLRLRIQISGNDDANEIFLSGLEAKDGASGRKSMSDQFSLDVEAQKNGRGR